MLAISENKYGPSGSEVWNFLRNGSHSKEILLKNDNLHFIKTSFICVETFFNGLVLREFLLSRNFLISSKIVKILSMEGVSQAISLYNALRDIQFFQSER